MVALATSSFFSPLVNAPLIGVITMRTPEALRAKVMTAVLTTALLAGPIGLLVAGPLLESWGPPGLPARRDRAVARDDPVRDRRLPRRAHQQVAAGTSRLRRPSARLEHVPPEVVHQLHPRGWSSTAGKSSTPAEKTRAPAAVS